MLQRPRVPIDNKKRISMTSNIAWSYEFMKCLAFATQDLVLVTEVLSTFCIPTIWEKS